MAERAETEFSMIFKNSASKMAAITTATRLLQALLDKPENHNLAEAWARALRSFGEDQLAVAFNTVALTSKGWPTLGDITEPIFDAEYAADWAWRPCPRRLWPRSTGWWPSPSKSRSLATWCSSTPATGPSPPRPGP